MAKMTTEEKRKDEEKIVAQMIAMYCHGNHHTKKGELCSECQELTDYCIQRSEHCPFMETKTFCAFCKVHCYKPDMRQKIKVVMKYSGPRMLFVHPAAAIKHMKEGIRAKRMQKKG